MSNSKNEEKVYILEDSADFIEILTTYLKKMGINFKVFNEPKDYLEQLAVKSPTLSLVDLNIGGHTLGFEVLKEVRKRNDNHPIIVISGEKSPHALTYSLECGANDFIQKPVTKPILNAKISNFLLTEELQNWISDETDVENEKIEATVNFDGTILGFDEVGFNLKSEHFLSSGTLVLLNGPIIEDIFKDKNSINTIVTSSSFDRDSSTYLSYAEFVNPTDEDIKLVKKWIHEKSQ